MAVLSQSRVGEPGSRPVVVTSGRSEIAHTLSMIHTLARRFMIGAAARCKRQCDVTAHVSNEFTAHAGEPPNHLLVATSEPACHEGVVLRASHDD